MATATRHPFTAAEWMRLRHYQCVLHRWAQDECNGTIQYDNDDTTARRYHSDRYGAPTVLGPIISDKSKIAIENAREIAAKHGLSVIAIENAREIAAKHGLSVYYQRDPRGCALYVYNVHDLKGRKIDECYSVIAQAVV